MIARIGFPLVLMALAGTAAAQDTVAASPKPRDTAATRSEPRPPKSSSTLLTTNDIEQVRGAVANAYDVVKMLRPRWLRTNDVRLPSTAGSGMQSLEVHVYVDDRDMGDVGYLRSIPPSQVFTLRYMSTAEVGARFGPASGPGIVVTLKR